MPALLALSLLPCLLSQEIRLRDALTVRGRQGCSVLRELSPRALASPWALSPHRNLLVIMLQISLIKMVVLESSAVPLH